MKQAVPFSPIPELSLFKLPEEEWEDLGDSVKKLQAGEGICLHPEKCNVLLFFLMSFFFLLLLKRIELIIFCSK